MTHDPSDDSALLTLKKKAIHDHGHSVIYREGVLDTIRSIEHEGRVKPNRMAILVEMLASNLGLPSMEEGEFAEVQHFLTKNHWTLEEGVEYVTGVRDTENKLSHFLDSER